MNYPQSLTASLRGLAPREASIENNRVLLDEIREWRRGATSIAAGDDPVAALSAARAA